MPYFYNFNKLLLTFFFISTQSVFAQAPEGYYTDAEGKSGYLLKTELFFIVDNHTDRGYSALWELYKTTDIRPDGFLLEIYSNCNFEFGTDQDNGTEGNSECDKYNREHTFPQSWFNSSSIPRSDAVMVLPSDKKVNSVRSNYPYGEVSNPSYTSLNGSKLGPNTLAGYSGTVFEPIDEYKGDLARIYFYMATRYQTDIDSWEQFTSESDIVLNGTETQVYEDWVVNMLIKWHKLDPVSQKEIDRNNAIYAHQGNRNPFVDRPEYVDCIWGESCNGQPIPKLETNTNTLNFGSVTFGDQPVVKEFILQGSEITQNISLSINSENFLVSNSVEGEFLSSLTISANGNGEVNDTIYVKFEAISNENQNFSEPLLISQAEVQEITISLEGSVEKDVEVFLSFVNYELNIDAKNDSIYEITVFSHKKLSFQLDFQLWLSGFNNISYPEEFSTTPEADGNIISLFIPENDSIAVFQLILDTALLKTDTEKSFSVSLLGSDFYQIGDKPKVTVNIAPYIREVTANTSAKGHIIQLYPNPAGDMLHIDNIQSGTFTIFDVHGKKVKSGNIDDPKIDVKQLAKGLYYLQINIEGDEYNNAVKFMKK